MGQGAGGGVAAHDVDVDAPLEVRITRTLDPDPLQAYVMYPGTPYEHLMLPVHTE